MIKKHRKGTLREAILAALPATQRELREKTGGSVPGVWRWMTQLCETDEAHIGAWTMVRGQAVAIYHPGQGANVACTVAKLSDEEVARRALSAERLRRRHADRDRAKLLAAPARRDPLVAAFFGPTGMA